jgi:hypothetical protein
MSDAAYTREDKLKIADGLITYLQQLADALNDPKIRKQAEKEIQKLEKEKLKLVAIKKAVVGGHDR